MLCYLKGNYLNRNGRKRTARHVRPAMIQISLRIRAVWSESSPAAFWIAKDAKFLHWDNEDSDQTARMRILIWVFVGCTCQTVRSLTMRFIFEEAEKKKKKMKVVCKLLKRILMLFHLNPVDLLRFASF